MTMMPMMSMITMMTTMTMTITWSLQLPRSTPLALPATAVLRARPAGHRDGVALCECQSRRTPAGWCELLHQPLPVAGAANRWRELLC